ncbi:MAG: DUF488 domain-containing protein [Candidatus Bipolaricaulota bacterium]|nr:DUF488 domain-containing protein [Candidatus Bipolaricaulota bacterium]
MLGGDVALRQTYLSKVKELPPDAEVVLVMRGRGNDELAPSAQLFRDFTAAKKRFTPDSGYASPIHYAWEECDYERRFRAQILGDSRALARLRELSAQAKDRDVFLVCYEGDDKPCHRKLLLAMAQEEFGAVVDPTPVRLSGGRPTPR